MEPVEAFGPALASVEPQLAATYQASTDPVSVEPQLTATFAIVMMALSIVACPDGSNVSLHTTLLPPALASGEVEWSLKASGS